MTSNLLQQVAHLDDNIGLLLLRVDECIEVRLAGLDGSLDALQRVPTLRHVTLDLPRELHLPKQNVILSKVQSRHASLE